MAKDKDKKNKITDKGGCHFCGSKTEPDYKDLEVLGEFLSNKNRIRPAEYTGLCRKHQKRVATEIKRARHLALMPTH